MSKRLSFHIPRLTRLLLVVTADTIYFRLGTNQLFLKYSFVFVTINGRLVAREACASTPFPRMGFVTPREHKAQSFVFDARIDHQFFVSTSPNGPYEE